MHIHLIAAARPNFMKIAPIYHALKAVDWADPIIVHTGQHYDLNMSDAFFIDLRLPDPDIHLGVGSGSHAEQTGQVMIAYEAIIRKDRPDLIVVVGDVNSTMAVTLAAVKLGVKVAHLEAGLRSFDRTMPEEINRLVTDAIADILWTPSQDADRNLQNEGVASNKIIRVGNIMIDSLEMMRSTIESEAIYKEFGCRRSQYGLVTLHRPANVDHSETLAALVDALIGISDRFPLIFPVHPRTRANLEKFDLVSTLEQTGQIMLTTPQSYIRFMNLVFNCKMAITDSGGIQEETTYLGIPCITLRPNTERPITVEKGTNRLCSHIDLMQQVDRVLNTAPGKTSPPDLWDGKTAERVVHSIEQIKLNA